MCLHLINDDFLQCANKKKENVSWGCSREWAPGRKGSVGSRRTMGLSRDALPSKREIITPWKIAPYHPETCHWAQHENQFCNCGSKNIIAPKHWQKNAPPSPLKYSHITKNNQKSTLSPLNAPHITQNNTEELHTQQERGVVCLQVLLETELQEICLGSQCSESWTHGMI